MGHAALRAAAVGPVGAAVTAVVGAMGVTGAGGASRAAVADPPVPALAATWVPGQQVRAHASAWTCAADFCGLKPRLGVQQAKDPQGPLLKTWKDFCAGMITALPECCICAGGDAYRGGRGGSGRRGGPRGGRGGPVAQPQAQPVA